MANDHFFSACPDTELAAQLDKLPPAPKIYTEDLPAARIRFNTIFTEIFHSVQRAQLPSKEAYATADHRVPVDGGSILVRTYRPSAPASTTFPLLVWTHGGGFVFGDVEMDDYYMRILSVDLQVAIANVEYRLAPETPFPGSLNDAYAALKWMIENARSLQADPAKGLIIGGQSAGANFPAVIAHRAKSDPFFAESPITGQVLQIPVLLHPDASPKKYADRVTSYKRNHDERVLNAGHMRDYFEKLAAPPNDPEVSILLQPSLTGLPPAYFQICGRDPLQDEGLVYAQMIKDHGVPVKVDEYPGVPHGFHLLKSSRKFQHHLSFPKSELAKQYDMDFRAGIRWLLGRPRGSA